MKWSWRKIPANIEYKTISKNGNSNWQKRRNTAAHNSLDKKFYTNDQTKANGREQPILSFQTCWKTTPRWTIPKLRYNWNQDTTKENIRLNKKQYQYYYNFEKMRKSHFKNTGTLGKFDCGWRLLGISGRGNHEKRQTSQNETRSQEKITLLKWNHSCKA